MSSQNTAARTNVLQVLLSLFVISVLGVFPIIYHDYYFDILRFKYYYYLVSAILFLVLSLAFLLWNALSRRSSDPEAGSPGWLAEIKALSPGARLPLIALLAFLFICTLSTLTSDYLYESFWGNEGRYTGLFLILLYCLVFLIISIFGQPKKWHLELFLVSSLVVCFVGLLDFIGLDPLHFKYDLSPQDSISFTSTIGNINTYTAFVSLSIGVSCILFATADSWQRSLWYLGCTLVFFLAIITGRSDNAYLALGVIFGFSPLFLFRRRSGIRRYFILLATFVTSIQIIDLVCNYTQAETPEMDGLFNVLVNLPALAPLMAALWILAAALYVLKHLTKEQDDNAGPWFQRAWLLLVALVLLGILFALYDANLAGNAERYGALGGYLRFDDSWGTNRGYAWRLAMKYYNRFPFIKKLIGYGPDTFGILTTDNDREEMIRLYNVIYDNAHNEYLQYLVTIGFLGLAAYLIFLISCGLRLIKASAREPWLMAFFFAVACYLAQAVVNLNVPITAPAMWLLLSLGMAGCRSNPARP